MANDGLLDFSRPFDRKGLILNAKAADAKITNAIIGARAERSMEGPSILRLSVLDTDHGLGGLFSERPFRTTLLIDDLSWTLSEIQKTIDGFELVFYDSASAALKRTKGAFKLGRGKYTRAQIVHGLCNKAGVAFASPDEDVRQPIQGFTAAEEHARRRARKQASSQGSQRGDLATGSKWWRGANITVKGQKADAEQLRNITTAMTVAEQLGAFPDQPRATKALLVAGIQESLFRAGASDYDTGTHKGVWQSNQIPPEQVATQAEYFLKGGRSFGNGGAMYLARKHPNMSPGTIAALTEVSSLHGENFADYDQWGAEADKIMAAYSPGEDEQSLADLQSLTGTPDIARVKKYEFRVEATETYWAAGVRLADEVNWRFFTINGTVWFVSDLTLVKATPSMVIRQGQNGIDRILWRFDQSARLTEMTVECRLTKWAALPGQVVVVEGETVKAANGRWLVRSIERDLLDTAGTATVTLGKPEQPKPEPKSVLITRGGSDPGISQGDGTPAKGGSALVGYPLAKRGSNLGGAAAHKARAWGNWQSDNAIDIGVPRGTDVFAVADGTIVRLGGSWSGGSGNPDGFNITLKTADNQWFYTHIMERAGGLFVGKEVERGAYLGKSGAANDADHLHLGVEHGDPEKLLGWT